jgi:hypothetical protein
MEADKQGPDYRELVCVQEEFVTHWIELGLTEGFFDRMYLVRKGLEDPGLDAVEHERLELLSKILNEQKTLVFAFNLSMANDPPVILDVADYM